MTDEETIAKLCEDEICAMYLAHCMVSPLRCGGLSYNAKGQLVNRHGRLWDDVMSEHVQEHTRKREAFEAKHRHHLIAKGMLH